ncbi:MAG: hypothetical protein NVSMB31_05620 [Vulcanimicrobiaceae bacterium]
MIYLSSVIGQAFQGFSVTFDGPRKVRAVLILTLGGMVATAFYLFMLPSPSVGGFSLIALQYLTPGLALIAALLGFGLSATLAINITAFSMSASSNAAGLGGFIASVLPGSLCCTSVVPSLLALAGASAPSIITSTGKIQSIFALHETTFLVLSVVGVITSVFLAARNAASRCVLREVPQ